MGGIGSQQLLLPRRRQRFHIAADIPGCEPQGTQTTYAQMGKVLTDTALACQHILKRRCQCGELRIIGELTEDALIQLQYGIDQIAPRGKTAACIIGQSRTLKNKR